MYEMIWWDRLCPSLGIQEVRENLPRISYFRIWSQSGFQDFPKYIPACIVITINGKMLHGVSNRITDTSRGNESGLWRFPGITSGSLFPRAISDARRQQKIFNYVQPMDSVTMKMPWYIECTKLCSMSVVMNLIAGCWDNSSRRMNFPPFKMILVLTNFSLLSFLIMLMVDHYNSHYNVESWSSAFHVLTLLWLSIRGAFWLCTAISTTPWNSMSFYALYWMANPIEFGSFMLLPLFFSQVLYPTYVLVLQLFWFKRILIFLIVGKRIDDQQSCYCQHGSHNIFQILLRMISF